MKFHYQGKYDLNPETLPTKEHKPGAVKFREAENSTTLAIIANLASILLLVICLCVVYMRYRNAVFSNLWLLVPCSLASLLILFPHEILHAVWFKEDVYFYTNFKQGMLFVVGPESMSKWRFVLMSFCPNLVFGVLPYVIGLLEPSLIWMSFFGAIAISMGAGDYYNIWNALTQMPRGARTYLHGFHSYWYQPIEEK